jgi:sugar phosphate isomerase/epimerase
MITGLLSTGIVNRFPDAARAEAIAQWLPRLAVDGFELSIGHIWDLDRVEQELAPLGLNFRAAHAAKRIGAGLVDEPGPTLATLEANCRLAASLGATTVVLHLWELPLGDRRFGENLALLPRCLDIADACGVTLAVETIPASVGSPLANVSRALEADSRCRATLDTEFLALYDELEAALEDDALWSRVAHVHVKDFDGTLRDARGTRHYLIPGEGAIDFDAVFEALRSHRYAGAVTLEVSAVTPEGRIDEKRLRQAESWLASRPWSLPFEVPARSGQNARP